MRRLTIRHWSWIHFKLAVLVWMILLATFTPTKLGVAVGIILILVATVTIIGSVVSIAGIIMTAQTGKTAVLGITVELGGLWFMLAGPAVYLFTQIYLAITLEDGDQRYALVALSYAFVAALLCRIVIVKPRQSRAGH